MDKKIIALVAITILALVSVLGAVASMEEDNDDAGAKENKPETQIREIKYLFEGTVDGPDDPQHGTCACENDHYKINNSVTRIVAVFRWEDTHWDLDVAIGIGGSPCTGEAVEEDDGGTIGNGEGEVTLECSDLVRFQSIEDGEEEEWFAHLEPDPCAYDCDYTVEVTITYLYRVEVE